MPKEKRLSSNVVAADNKNDDATKSRNAKLEEKVVVRKSLLPTVQSAINSKSKTKTGSVAPIAETSTSATNQTVHSSKSNIKRSTSKSSKRKSSRGPEVRKRVKFSQSSKSSVSATSQKSNVKRRTLEKKKTHTRPRSSSSSTMGSKVHRTVSSSVASLNGPNKHKVKAKRNRAISTVTMPSSSGYGNNTTEEQAVVAERAISNVTTPSSSGSGNNTTEEQAVVTTKSERIFTRTPLENALVNALRSEIAHNDSLRASGGGAASVALRTDNLKKYPTPAVKNSTMRHLSPVKKISVNPNFNLPKANTLNVQKPKPATFNSRIQLLNAKPNARAGGSGVNSKDEASSKNKRTNGGKKDGEERSSQDSNASTSSQRKRKLTEENSAKVSNENIAATGPSTSAQSAEDDNDKEEEEDKDAKKKKNRCAECRKKVGLTGFQCRCGGLYCAVHRYSDKHNCTFNYREHGAQEIRRNNPVVVGEKIQKI